MVCIRIVLDSLNQCFPIFFSSEDPSGHVQNIRGLPKFCDDTYLKASLGMLLRKIFEFWVSEMAFPSFFEGTFWKSIGVLKNEIRVIRFYFETKYELKNFIC